MNKTPYRTINGEYIPTIIMLDSETNQYLDRYCEPRNMDDAIHKYEYNGTVICWVKRTPEEKGERPYMRKDTEIFTEDRPCPMCINGTMENEGRTLIGDRRDYRYKCNNCSTEMNVSIDLHDRQWSKKHKAVCIIDEGSTK